MYLQNLNLNNFRSFGQSEIPLCRDLTILVGENNGGKSNAIDAIRLLTAPLGGRRGLYCEATDIRFGSAGMARTRLRSFCRREPPPLSPPFRSKIGQFPAQREGWDRDIACGSCAYIARVRRQSLAAFFSATLAMMHASPCPMTPVGFISAEEDRCLLLTT